MALRERLTLYFAFIVLLPLTVAAFVGQRSLDAEIKARAEDQVSTALNTVVNQLDLQRARVIDVGLDLIATGRDLGGALEARDAARVQVIVDEVVGPLRDGPERVDVVIVTDADGGIVGAKVAMPVARPGAAFPEAEELVETLPSTVVDKHLLGTVLPIGRVGAATPIGYVVLGRWLDDELAKDVVQNLAEGQRLRFVAGEVTLGMTGLDAKAFQDPLSSALGERTLLPEGGEVEVRGSLADVEAAQAIVRNSTLLFIILAAVSAAALGWLLSRVVTRPVHDLADAARDVAAGNLDRETPVRGNDELADLARAFNTMTENLREQVEELEDSRGRLQHSLETMGETLSSNLDVNRTLAAVVDTAMGSLRASAAALYMFRPDRRELYLKVGRGVGRSLADVRIALGTGLIGSVAESGVAVMLTPDSPVFATPGPDEHQATEILAVPLVSPSTGDTIGVLALYGHASGQLHTAEDLATLRSFAAQGSVAIENVRLHEATEQASVTDGLTGLWNLRYLQEQAHTEVERANRFGHDLSMIVLDIDHFKNVNDRHGHPGGDRVLIEVSRRIAGEVRAVDTLARYGGEEFVIVLPETALEGARQTAERIRSALAVKPIRVGDVQVDVTASLGVATFPEHGLEVDVLLRAADTAMYVAKESGRNRVVTATIGGPSGPGSGADA